MSDWKFLNNHRLSGPQFGPYSSTPQDGFNGAFRFPLPGEARAICCIASDGEGWKHVSVSFGAISKNVPSWDIMCKVKDLFWEPEDWVAQFHPAHSEYVNNHSGCLHLWQPTEHKLPTPNSILVGIKDLNQLR